MIKTIDDGGYVRPRTGRRRLFGRVLGLLLGLAILCPPVAVVHAGPTMQGPPGGGQGPGPAASGSPAAAAAPANLFSPGIGQPLEFEHISLDEGLSNSTVTAILQDRDGFLWVGTARGLNKYNGYDFTAYLADAGREGALQDDLVRALLQDRYASLWVGTDEGLYHLNRQEDRFDFYPSPKETAADYNPILTLFEDRAGTLWVGTSDGLYRFDRSKGTYHSYRRTDGFLAGLGDTDVHAIFEDADRTLWVGAKRGLYGLAREAKRFRFYRPNPEALRWQHNSVQTIAGDTEGHLWIGTDGGGFHRFDPDGRRFTQYLPDPLDVEGLTDNRVFSIHVDGEGVIWVGTIGGLYQFDAATETLAHYQTDPRRDSSLSSNYVLTISESQPGLVWIGTQGGGINKYDRLKNKFVAIQHDPDRPDGLSLNTVLEVLEDSRGLLWIGTEGGGLSRLDRATGQWRTFRHDPTDPSSLGSDYVIGLLEDRAGNLWIGTWGAGLCRFDLATERCTHFRADPLDSTSLSTDLAIPLHQDQAGNLWVATYYTGLDKLENPEEAVPEESRFRHIYAAPGAAKRLNSGQVMDLKADAEGRFWIATTGGGLHHFDPVTEQFVHFGADETDPNSLRSDFLLSLLIDHAGTLWIGSTAGLHRYDPASGGFTVFTEADGLPNAVIFGILEDAEGCLWLSTQHGLARFKPHTGEIRDYGVSDGLQGTEFTTARVAGRDGALYFGGINGLNVVYPDRVQENQRRPPVVFTALRASGKNLDFARPIEDISAITLNWPDNDLEFEFAALNFSQPNRNQYAYKLEGFDEEWQSVGTRRFGRYTNLPGGLYTLHVKASNNDGVWNETGTALTVTVVPPVWQTVWFQVLVGLLLIAGVVGGYRLRVKNIQDRSLQLEAEVAIRTHEIELRRQEMAALYRADEELYAHLQLDDVLEALVDIAVDVLRADKAAVLCWDDNGEELSIRLARGFKPESVPVFTFRRGEGLVGEAVATARSVISEDAATDPRRENERPEVVEAALAEGIRSFMQIPIQVNGENFGVFNVDYTKPHAFGPDERRLFEALARRAAQAIENARIFDAEQRRAEQFRVISEVGSQITAIMPVTALLERLVTLIHDAFGYYHVGVGLIEGDEVVYRVGAGELWDDPEFQFKPARLKVGEQGISGWVAATGEPMLVDDVRSEPRYVWMQGSRCRSELTVPIKVKEEIIGVLDVQSEQIGAFDETDLSVLQALAHQTGAAIENTHLYEQAQRAAVVEERSRLARDLHDAVTQTLFSASLLAEVLPATWQADQGEGEKLLQELRQLNRGALAEMRTLLLELRPAVLVEAPLPDLLRQLAEAAAGRSSLTVQVHADGRCQLPEDVHVALYRIAQEALNNVVKHSQASRVDINLTCVPTTTACQGRFELSVVDDGIGLDLAGVPPDHLGLGIIRERAQTIDADLTITTVPGEGTTVKVVWPGR